MPTSPKPDDDESATVATATIRHRRRNAPLVRYVASHFVAVIAEWSLMVGVLVYAYEHDGSTAAGVASLAALAPYLLLSSAMARIVERYPPALVRAGAQAAGSAGCAVAAVAVFAGGPTWIVVAGSIVLFTASTTLRPAGAVVVPALVRSSRELMASNIWVGHCENASELLAPVVATVLLGIGGPGASIAGCAVLAAIAAAIAFADVRSGPPATRDVESSPRPARRVLGSLWRAATIPVTDLVRIGRRPGAGGVLMATAAQSLLFGAIDLLVVVIAAEHLDLGDAGAGVLTALSGVGAFASSAIANRAVDRPLLAPAMLVTMVVMAGGCIVFGVSITIVMACVVMPVLGLSGALLSLMCRVLLQRSAPPSELASVFGAIETSAGLGLVAGSITAQVLIAMSGAGAALIGVGVLFGILVAALIGPLRRADEGADVPVVAMSLLKRTAVFAPLPIPELEAVARSAEELTVSTGDVVIRQGDRGDRFYAVADGSFDVDLAGEHVRTIERGGSFGEVALLADTPRTATVTATEPGLLLAIERAPFLVAVTGHNGSRQAAWGAMRALRFDGAAPAFGPPPGSEPL